MFLKVSRVQIFLFFKFFGFSQHYKQQKMSLFILLQIFFFEFIVEISKKCIFFFDQFARNLVDMNCSKYLFLLQVLSRYFLGQNLFFLYYRYHFIFIGCRRIQNSFHTFLLTIFGGFTLIFFLCVLFFVHIFKNNKNEIIGIFKTMQMELCRLFFVTYFTKQKCKFEGYRDIKCNFFCTSRLLDIEFFDGNDFITKPEKISSHC
eukprot:TRINITY_DN28760_c0_g3_i4.p2 TRINITY_DN28760_c0_g3~~TRINITY_DN28760_c0_g3_i4.p2  ORF type:complete len:204 (-),score=1.63 TRINITY_DN28760_c0_g3_i4:274-885(-)